MKSGVPNSRMSSRANGLQFTSSIYGTAVPWLAGRTKLTPKLVDAFNFQSQQVQQQGGKKGGGGGKKGQGTELYNYYTACDLLLGHYPIRLPMTMWSNKDIYNVYLAQTVATVSGGAVTIPSTGLVGVLAVTVQVSLSGTINDYGGDGAEAYSVTQELPLWNEFYPLPDGTAGSGRRQNTFSWNPASGGTVQIAGGTSALDGKQVTVYYVNASVLSQLNLEFEPYLASGSEYSGWSFRQVAYNWVSGIGSPKFDCGQVNLFPTLNFECVGSLALFADGDCDPADILTELITSGVRTASDAPYAGDPILITHGLNLTSIQVAGAPLVLGSLLGDTSAMSAYCRANNIRCSLYLDAQRAARDIIQEILDVANTAPVLSGDVLKCVPYSEVSAVGNGTLYTPPTAAGPLADLDDTCFVLDGNNPPVSIDRNRQADAENVLPIEHISRQAMYETKVTTEVEQRSVHQFNTRKSSVRQMHSIQDDVVAQKVASCLVKRNAFLRNVYRFSLPVTYSWLEAMDLVRILEYRILGVGQYVPVRLTQCTESWDDKKGWQLQCEAEKFVYGLNAPTPMETQDVSVFTPLGTADPGDVNPPIFLELPDSANDGFNLWIAVSGSGANWGGCVVWISVDGSTYRPIGTVIGATVMGSLTATLASGADPDTTNTLSVDLTESATDLVSVTATERDAFDTLSWVDGELISYETVSMTAAHKYDITSLRRGAFGTPIGAHSSGTVFARLDNVLKTSLPASYIGQTVSFKFTSFNQLGGGAQQLDDVTAYTYTFQGHYGNFLQIAANSMTVDNVPTPAGGPYTAATIRAYGKVSGVPTVDTNGMIKRTDGNVFTVPYLDTPGQALSTTFYAMFRPKEGTSYWLSDYVSMMTAVYNGHICIDATRTPDAGGSGGSTGGGGGPVGGGCPWVEMEFQDGLEVGDACLGDRFDCLDGEKPLLGIRRKYAIRCVRLVAENGAEYIGAWDTRFELANGRMVLAEKMLGHSMLTDEGPGTPRIWSPIKIVEDVGCRDVVSVDLGNRVFAARVKGTRRRSWSHNLKPAPDV